MLLTKAVAKLLRLVEVSVPVEAVTAPLIILTPLTFIWVIEAESAVPESTVSDPEATVATLDPANRGVVKLPTRFPWQVPEVGMALLASAEDEHQRTRAG